MESSVNNPASELQAEDRQGKGLNQYENSGNE